MSSGGGKYERECGHVMMKTSAKATMLIVMEGNRGNGHEYQMRTGNDRHAALDLIRFMAGYLRDIATDLEKDIARIEAELHRKAD